MTDTLTAEVLRNALMVAAEEASIVVVRSAYSTFIVEGSDASAAILDSGGRLIAQSVATTLANSMSLSLAVPHIVDAYPLTTMAPGDVFATNDAYQGGIHTNDIIVVRPVFVEGAVEFFTGTLIHVSDLGGMSAGGMAALATDIFLEGLQLPPVRIASQAGLDPAIERILRLNSRTPDKVIGDVRALIAGATTSARRIETLAAELGPAALRRGVLDYLDYTAARMRRALAGLTPGVYHAEYPIDDDGIHLDRPLTVRVTVTIDGEQAVLDFEGTDPQVPAAVNSSVSQALAGAVFAVRCFLDPTIPMNDGSLRPLSVRLPVGSLVNAQSPFPCGGRFIAVYAAMEAVLQAMSDAVPSHAIAPSGILQPFSIAARHAPFWIHLSYDYGGVGARAGRDGPDATGIHFGLGRNSVPQAEPVEVRCPLVVEAIEYIPDSGGPGRWRGGLATRTTIRLLDDADITTRGDRLRLAPPGRDGGGAGRLGGFYRVPAAGDPERLPAKNNNVHFRAGDAFVVETTGGGGLGPPHERSIEAVCRDVAEGKVSMVSAAEQYGVVLADDGAADQAATGQRRQMAGR